MGECILFDAVYVSPSLSDDQPVFPGIRNDALPKGRSGTISRKSVLPFGRLILPVRDSDFELEDDDIGLCKSIRLMLHVEYRQCLRILPIQVA